MVERKLGRGLDFLIKRPQAPEAGPGPGPVSGTAPPAASRPAEPAAVSEPRALEVGAIIPNPFQPRRVFGIEELNELIESIRQHGVLQPVAVRRTPAGYELISGERRWRAAQELGLETIPVVIHEADDQKMLELALIENIQREDLNAIEKAKAYRQLIRQFSLTQDEAARRLAVKRSTVANHLRLLELGRDLQDMVADGRLGMGHARALLAIEDVEERGKLARRVPDEQLSVRDVERHAAARKEQAAAPAPVARETSDRRDRVVEAERDALSARLTEALGTRVQVQGDLRRGKVVIDYYDAAFLERLIAAVERGGAA